MIAEKIVTEPCTDIYVKSKLIKDNDWEKTLAVTLFSERFKTKKNDKIQNLPYFSDGHWWVQGLSATFPVKIFNEIYSKKIKKQISLLDVGSAPGEKHFNF